MTSLNADDVDNAYVRVETVGLPTGCKVHMTIRDKDSNRMIHDERKFVAAGDAATVFAYPSPEEEVSYHAKAVVERNGSAYNEIISGASLKWTE